MHFNYILFLSRVFQIQNTKYLNWVRIKELDQHSQMFLWRIDEGHIDLYIFIVEITFVFQLPTVIISYNFYLYVLKKKANYFQKSISNIFY